MSNKMIGICANCGQYYCMECSTHENFENFCSDQCEKDQSEELLNFEF